MNEQMLEELTLYLDGQHPNPVKFEEKMILDKELAQRCREYQALSRSLRMMPAPEVHPAFATRVMAHLNDKPITDWRGVMRAWQRVALLPACVLLMAAGAMWMRSGDAPNVAVEEPVLQSADAGALVASAAKWGDDEAVINELMAMMSSGVDAGALLPYDAHAWYAPSQDEVGYLFEGVAGDWEMDKGLYGDGGVYDVLNGIQADEINEVNAYLNYGQ